MKITLNYFIYVFVSARELLDDMDARVAYYSSTFLLKVSIGRLLLSLNSEIQAYYL